MQTQALLELATAALEDMKAQDLTTLDIGEMSSIADFMIVATATSSRHAKSLADEVSKCCKDAGHEAVNMEGQEQAEWILIDLGDVIVHVMQGAARKLYDLESLWQLKPGK